MKKLTILLLAVLMICTMTAAFAVTASAADDDFVVWVDEDWTTGDG